MALHTISLCTGLGGIERGLELAAPGAFKPVLYCEREISSAAIIAQEIERGNLPAAPIWSDLKTLTGGSVARYLDQVGVDCITGGYPCQPFSVAGKRLGEDDERHLWPAIAEAIERYAPTLCFFENVGGHLILGFREVCECLERLGYWVAAGLFTAAEIGAGHRRERLFILADSSSQRPQGFDLEQEPNERGTGRGSGADVGNTTVVRRDRHTERPERQAAEEGWMQNTSGRHLPPFPPGPSSHDWRDILERWPGLAPAIGVCEAGDLLGNARSSGQHEGWTESAGQQRSSETVSTSHRPSEEQATQPTFRGVADGLSRADQLRAYGNAVVPHCAAVAFVSLWAALRGGDQ